MRWVHLVIFILASTDAKKEDSNEIAPLKSSLPNLDSNLRRALLKALTELENEENEKNPSFDTKDKIVEKASASALSFFASTEPTSTTEKLSTSTEEITEKSVVVVQKSSGLQHKPIITLEQFQSDSFNEPEQIITSASSSFTSSSNKPSYTKQNNLNLVSNEVKATTKFFRLPKTEATTVTPTTSTEESEAKVEDVQFFSAPLVAAFTVHQDERGLPKSVEPIYKSKIEQLKPHSTLPPTQQPVAQQQEQIRTQLALQEKQKALEAEILRLKQQQQQQNYLIRQQQILHQQQLQIQKQKILDEQTRLFQNQQSFTPTANTNFNKQHTTQRTEFSTTNTRNKGNLVSFQPSLSFTSQQYPQGVLPFNAQQLPVRNAANFRTPFAHKDNHFQQFSFLNQQPPLESSATSFNFAPTSLPQLTLTAPKHHRVFRQESTTGNFFNSFNNNFDHVSAPQQSNRFFRSNVEIIPSQYNRVQSPLVNQQLNHLLYNSGLIRGNKQQEDLNIVSKVLSLNHHGGDYKFGSSNINEQKVPAPIIKKV